MNTLLTLLATFAALTTVKYLLADDNAILPDIWPAIRSDKSYHLMFQVWMRNSRDRLVLEEWASFKKNLFRLDLITDKLRTTYLINGNTGEIFRYKPFVCNQLSESSKELAIISYLFKGFRLNSVNGKQVCAYGLGPLWLRAKSDARGIRLMDTSSKSKQLLKIFVGYETTGWSTETSEQEKNDYKLRLYFSSKEEKFIDGVEWVESIVSDETKKRGLSDIAARAKVIFTDLRPIDESIFDLPTGYGCQRDPSLEHDGRISDLTEDLFRIGTPTEVLLEVTTSKPSNSEFNKWLSQRHLVQVVRGTLERNQVQRNYYVTTVQYRARSDGEFVRQKLVWSAREGVSLSTVYFFDSSASNQETCTSKQLYLRNLITLQFPNYGQFIEHSTLSLELIEWLFKDSDDYHLIRQQVLPQDEKKLEQRVDFYEKRITKLEQEGSPSSPVSIVKKVKSSYVIVDREVQGNSARIPLSSQTTITLLFYSEDFSVIMSKAVIEQLESKELDITQMHQQMDVSTCFAGKELQKITIKYPMRTRELSNALERFKQPLTEQFLIHLFASTTVELLQVAHAKLTFDDFFMHFELKLLELPLTHTFELTRKLQLVNRKTGDVLEITTSNSEKCAAACEHYDCRRFSFNWSAKACRIELNQGAAKVESAFLSDLYSYYTPTNSESSVWNKALLAIGASDALLNPTAILNVFRELLTYKRSNENELVPLKVQLPRIMLSNEDAEALISMGDIIDLEPISVVSEIDYMDELNMNNTELQALGRYSNMRVEYAILFYWFRLNDEVVFDHIKDVPYEECAGACEAADCRSFSYNSFNQYCRLSQLQSKNEIEASIEKEGSSVVYIIDYLSKFERLGMRSKPIISTKVLDKVQNAQDCATACMEELGFACQGFDLCRTAGCLLTKNHVSDIQNPEDRIRFINKHGELCIQFSRSLLSQFDKYYGRALKLPQDQQVVLHDLGAEKCAQGCLHNSCAAFHICREQNTEGILKQHCLLSKSEIKKSNVAQQRSCNTFVLSERSQFSQHKRINWAGDKLEPDKSSIVDYETSLSDNSKDIILDQDRQDLLDQDVNKVSLKTIEPIHILAHSGWFAGVFYLLMGLALGLLGTIIWQERKLAINIVNVLTK